MVVDNMQGFKVLPLQFSSMSSSCHHLFIKEHSIRQLEEDKPAGKTLFVLNIPPYATEKSLKLCFSKVGNVKSVLLEDNNDDGFKKAFIVFDKRDTLIKALKLDTLVPLSTDEAPLNVGLATFMEEYNSRIYDPSYLENNVNKFIESYEIKEKGKCNAEIDDEGWTVITKKGRHPGISRKEGVQLKLEDKKNKNYLKNFYAFQNRESKMETIEKLRKDFEKAKNNIQLMKNARKFKPY